VRHTCVEKKGKLVIPAFSVDRTQEIVYLLDQMSNEGLLPNIKVYVDSPLSVKATEVIRKHRECYNPTFIDYIKKDPDPFGFKNLTYVSQVEDSKRINLSKEPCIIISASGMAEAGRIKHHIKNTIENSANTILIVGYCTPESLGGRLKNGDKEVRIFGEEYTVKAQVESLDYYSAHADYNEIFKWLTCQDLSLVKKIFLVHGETDAQEYLRDLFIGKGVKAPIVIPQLFETHRI
jgi:metallo-beta-lactamase family protein